MTQQEQLNPAEIWIKRGGHQEADWVNALPIPGHATKYIRADAIPAQSQDMTVPEIPDGWHLFQLSETDGGPEHKWVVQLWHEDADEPNPYSWGATPNAAVSGAISKITTPKKGG